jgi:hypothetical protein
MTKRRRNKQTDPLKARLVAFAKDLRDQAALLSHGPEKDDLMRRARQADTATHLHEMGQLPRTAAAEMTGDWLARVCIEWLALAAGSTYLFVTAMVH